ncbi:MAG: T9SS type A sorting domain-containing protein [Bacteroidia bacterium]
MKKTFLLSSFIFTTLVLSAQLPSYVPADSLTGFWDFNNNANNALAGGISLTYLNSLQFSDDRNGTDSAALVYGLAYNDNFSGFNAQQFTVGGWVKPGFYPDPNSSNDYFTSFFAVRGRSLGPSGYNYTNIINLGSITDKGFDPNFPVIIDGPDQGKLYFYIRPMGANRLTSTARFDINNTWVHVIATYDGSYAKLYINGTCTDSMLVNSTINYSHNNTDDIAGFFATSQLMVNIYEQLDKMAYWRRALSACEIDSLYNESNLCGGSGNPTNIYEQNVADIKIYPNPVKTNLTIENLDKSSNYQIIDITGRVVLSGKLYNSSNQISTEELTNGVYYLKINGFKTQKLIVKH